MEDEKILDSKEGEEKTPAGIGQPEEKTDSGQEKPEGVGASEEEIDIEEEKDVDVSGKEVNELLEDSEETVYVSKKLLRQLKQDRDNYREGMLSNKKKLASFKKEGEKAELQREEKDIENKGVQKACEDVETNENWREIVKYYSSRRGKSSVEDIVNDIKDAKILWKQYSSKKDEGENEDKKSKSDLSSLGNEPQGAVEEGKEKTKERLIIPKQKEMKDWYK